MPHKPMEPIDDEEILREIDAKLGSEFADTLTGQVRQAVARESVLRYEHARVRNFVPLLAFRTARERAKGILEAK